MEGCRRLADMYLTDDSIVPDVEATGPLQDLERAARLLTQACDGDDMLGCSNLGELFDEGRGVPEDLERAAELWLRACDGEALRGCAQLGRAFEQGRGVEVLVSRAVELYEQACEGDMLGCMRLAQLYTTDAIGPPDFEVAPHRAERSRPFYLIAMR